MIPIIGINAFQARRLHQQAVFLHSDFVDLGKTFESEEPETVDCYFFVEFFKRFYFDASLIAS